MSQAFTVLIGLKIRKINIKAQKIAGITLETYKIINSIFSVLDKDNRKRFFKESFLFADVNLDVLLGMFFLIINNADIDFQAYDLQWRSYSIRDVFLTTR